MGPAQQLSEQVFVLKLEGPVSFRIYQGFLNALKTKRGVGVVTPILMSRAQIELQVSSSRPINAIIHEVRRVLAEEEVFLFISRESPEGISLRIEHNSEPVRD